MIEKTGNYIKIVSYIINNVKYYIVCSKRGNRYIQSFKNIKQAIEKFKFEEFKCNVLRRAYEEEG